MNLQSQKIYSTPLQKIQNLPQKNNFAKKDLTKSTQLHNGANSKQQTANSKQQTANSKQQTANSKQQTANLI
jgi:hypothetical protein